MAGVLCKCAIVLLLVFGVPEGGGGGEGDYDLGRGVGRGVETKCMVGKLDLRFSAWII